MKRLIDWHLEKWKEDSYRKPLLIRGARQVGKTYAIRKLGKKFDHLVEVNFELIKDAKKIFEKDLQPERIVRELNLLLEQKIIPGKTLLFFDEIQECPEAIQSLRYFFELMPQLHVIAAGSLLDFALEKIGMPVGRVSSLYVFPVSFIEFLAATGHKLLIEAILQHSSGEEIAEVVHLKLLNLVGEYLSIGGMPEALSRWIETKDPHACFEVHQDLIDTYRQDFQKYASKHQIKYVEQLFSQIPHLTGQQFKYSIIHGEYRKRDLAPCLDLLNHANIIHKICHSAAHGLPLGAEASNERFKITFFDVALCQAILGLDLSTWFLQPEAEFVNRGQITESFIGQELLAYSSPKKRNELYFWKREIKSSHAEVDFLYDFENSIVPIEVKSGHGSTLRSMHVFLEEHPQSHYGIRFSAQNYSIHGKINSRPLYAVCSLAHEDQQQSLFSLL